MTQKNEIYRCLICGNIVEVHHDGAGVLKCCEKDMMLLRANTQDAATEKHVPVIDQINEHSIRVFVGDIAHPMDRDHYIEWVTCVTGDKIQTVYLKSGMQPEAFFEIDEKEMHDIVVYAYCNLHGLWQSTKK